MGKQQQPISLEKAEKTNVSELASNLNE